MNCRAMPTYLRFPHTLLLLVLVLALLPTTGHKQIYYFSARATIRGEKEGANCFRFVPPKQWPATLAEACLPTAKGLGIYPKSATTTSTYCALYYLATVSPLTELQMKWRQVRLGNRSALKKVEAWCRPSVITEAPFVQRGSKHTCSTKNRQTSTQTHINSDTEGCCQRLIDCRGRRGVWVLTWVCLKYREGDY